MPLSKEMIQAREVFRKSAKNVPIVADKATLPPLAQLIAPPSPDDNDPLMLALLSMDISKEKAAWCMYQAQL
jgi:hypothetical protein